MAKLKVLGSSSKGNGYVIETSDGYLLLECGVPLGDVLSACKFNSKSVSGCLLSHIHGDHSRHSLDYIKRGISVYTTPDTAEALKRDAKWMKRRVNGLKDGVWTYIGSFKVLPFCCQHDVENFGYIVKHNEIGTLLFGTDTFAYPHIYRGVNHFVVEANYSDALLASSNVDEAMKRRLMVSHMSIDYCVKYLHECKAEKADTITLVHLSSRHSNADKFKSVVRWEFGVPTYIADKGLEVDISNQIIN